MTVGKRKTRTGNNLLQIYKYTFLGGYSETDWANAAEARWH